MKAQKPNTQNKSLDEFISEAADSKINNTLPKTKGNDDNSDSLYKRQTYYIEPLYIKALGLMSEYEDTAINVLVRGFFEKCIPQDYVDKARDILNKRSGR